MQSAGQLWEALCALCGTAMRPTGCWWQCGDNAMDKGRDAAVLLSFAMLRNTARAKTSIIMRAHKIINHADKTSEQIDPKQKDRGETSAVD